MNRIGATFELDIRLGDTTKPATATNVLTRVIRPTSHGKHLPVTSPDHQRTDVKIVTPF